MYFSDEVVFVLLMTVTGNWRVQFDPQVSYLLVTFPATLRLLWRPSTGCEARGTHPPERKEVPSFRSSGHPGFGFEPSTAQQDFLDEDSPRTAGVLDLPAQPPVLAAEGPWVAALER